MGIFSHKSGYTAVYMMTLGSLKRRTLIFQWTLENIKQTSEMVGGIHCLHRRFCGFIYL
jgi:hypothetical protein